MRDRQNPAMPQSEKLTWLIGACMYFILNISFMRQTNENVKQWDTIPYTTLCAFIVLPEILFTYAIYVLPSVLIEIGKILHHDAAKQEIKFNKKIASAAANVDKLTIAGFPDELIPDEFRCDMVKAIMSTPVKLTGTTQVYDHEQLQTWLRHLGHTEQAFQFHNMGNNQTITYPDDVHPQLKLQHNIQTYVNTVIQQVQIIRQQRSQRLFARHVQLTPDDFRIIHEHAMQAVQGVAFTPSLTLRK